MRRTAPLYARVRDAAERAAMWAVLAAVVAAYGCIDVARALR